MHPSPLYRTVTPLTLLLGLAAPGCLGDSVSPDPQPPVASAPPPPENVTDDDPEPAAAIPPALARPASVPENGPAPADLEPSAPVEESAGDCDLGGRWLITQRTIASGLGVKQRVAWWFYYELEQTGSALSVTRGLVCGSQVFPVDPLSAAVEFDDSFPALIENNSHAGRRGSVVANGDDCDVSFDRAVIVLGATMPFYADEANALPSLEQPASDTAPGWEDWDEDGNPAVSLNVSGLVQGSRYTALRAFSVWGGTIPASASTFQLPVSDWGQEEAVLGVTAEVLEQTGVPDADRSGHFTEFARLTPEQAQGDPETVCATVRQLAPMLTPDANR